MTHAILERKLLLSLHMEGKNVMHWLYCTHITNAFASTFRIASTQLPRPSCTAAQSARVCRSNLSEMATIVLDSDLIPKKPNNRNRFKHQSRAPVVLHSEPVWFHLRHISDMLWHTMLLAQQHFRMPESNVIFVYWQNAMAQATEWELGRKQEQSTSLPARIGSRFKVAQQPRRTP